MDPEQKSFIDSLSQYQLCYRWRFAECGDPLFQGECGKYFSQRLQEMGGFTPEISKSLGW
jgi:hypothetical protein